MDGRALSLDDDDLLEELGWVRSLACRLLADSNDADDLVQEAWIKARGTPAERFGSRSRLRAWLAAVTRRMARDTLRARRRRARREAVAARGESVRPADVVERSALLEALLHSVRALEEPYRSTVLLRYLDGYATAQVAALMSVSEELVRKRLSRALARLRNDLRREWGGALPACAEEDLGLAPRGTPPHSDSLVGAGGFASSLLASLGLALIALLTVRPLPSAPSAGINRSAPEFFPVALDTPSSSRNSGAVPSEPAESTAPAAVPAAEPAPGEPAPVAVLAPDESAAPATDPAAPPTPVQHGPVIGTEAPPAGE